MRSEVKKLGRDYRGDTPETGEGDDTFHVTKDSSTLPRRDRLRSTRETSLASCEAEGDNTSLASCEARGRHPWPGRHTDGIQRAQPTLAGNRWRQQMPRTATSPQPRLRRRGERPWPGSTPLRLRSRGRQHFPGQTPTLHTCEAEGDNTSLARYYTFTSAKPRDDPGQTPHRHRPRERLPDPEYCPREHISDKEIFRATSSPLLRQELPPRREIINTEVSFWHLSTLLTTDDCSCAITPTVTIVVSTASVSYFRLYILYLF